MRKLKKGEIVVVSGILAGVGYILKVFSGYSIATIVLMITATLVAGMPIFKKAISAIRYKIVGIDALVTIAVIGAVIIGEYWEAAAVTFLFILGDYLESRTIEKTRSSIKSLLSLVPDTALVRRGNEDIEVAYEDVAQNEIVIVKPGARIPVDGIVIEGSAYVNQAAITGEPMAVHKNINDNVYSGTVAESGYILVKAEKVGEDTVFSRILQMVEEAQDKKAKTQKFLEKFSRYYTPGVILLSLVMFLVTKDIRMALTLLVISCPGALVISAPVSIVAGIGNGAKNGVLIKGGDIVEKLAKVKAIAFDKTGTLTKGKPGVVGILAYGIDENELLKIAASGEMYSEHPIARAITAKANELNLQFDKPEDTEILTGMGIKFILNNETYYIGNRKLFTSYDIDTSMFETTLQSEEDKGVTAVLVGNEDKVLGIVSVADMVRENAKKTVKSLKSIGIKKTIMLTGDNKRAARVLAQDLGIDEYFAELMPEDKVKAIKEEKVKYGTVAMVGDGINDAPALATSDLGIAIGGIGADVAMETADIVLMSSDVGRLPYAVDLAKTTVRNMKQNIVFALIVAGVLLAGVIVKTVDLSLGMFVHEISVLLVILNAVRLLRFKGKIRE